MILPASCQRVARRAQLACAALAACAGAARAQAFDVFGPLDAGWQVSQAQWYDQVWSTPARTAGGWTIVWSAGQDVILRRFGRDLAPTGPDLLVNTTLNLDQQDEPAIGVATGGQVLVAWSERHGYDGEQMGIFGRIYHGGMPLGAEFRVNQAWQASQWRPLIAATPTGGFAVAWSGDWDGDAFLRLFTATGVPISGDVAVNQYEYDAQVDPALAVAPDGTIFVAFVDFSSHGGVGSGLNLWGRRFDQLGVPLSDEFPLPSTFVNGDQRLPRVACDGLGRFSVVWQDDVADGSDRGIALRRFATDGTPLGPDLVVNTTTAGAQLGPVVCADPDGTLLVAWEDWSLGAPRLRGRRIAPDGQPLGGEIALTPPGVWAERPAPWSDAASGDLLLGYDVWNGADYDVYARRFRRSAGPQTYCTAKVNSQGCTPAIASAGTASASSPAPFTVLASNVISNKFGLLVYGLGSAFTPFQGGTLCVQGPRRTGAQNSGGNAGGPDCSGTFAYDFNALVRSGVDAALAPGATVSVQWYYRDVQDPAGYGSGLSDALRFTIAP